MDDEDYSSSCSCSTSSTESNRRHRRRQKSKYDSGDQLNPTLSRSQTSSFDPAAQQFNTEIRTAPLAPIIIEKVVPNAAVPMPTLGPPAYIIQRPLPQQPILHPPPIAQSPAASVVPPYSESYQINERGEKITADGNRIVYMDVIQPNMVNQTLGPTSIVTQPAPPTRSHRRRRPKQVPVVDLQTIEQFFNEKHHRQRRASAKSDHASAGERLLSTSDMLDIVEGYFEDYKGRKIKLNGHDAQEMLNRLETSGKSDRRASESSSHKAHRHRRENHSTINAGPSLNYVERSMIQTPSQHAQTPQPPTFINDKVNEYVSNIYGSSERSAPSVRSSSSHRQQPDPSANPAPAATDAQAFISPFRYMQSSVNPLLLREYRQAFGGV